MILLNRLIIGFKPIKYTPFWHWYRLMVHQSYRFDDRHLYTDFWWSINGKD
jgi:hypothetical protein